MNYGHLNELYTSFATKRITLVEAESTASNGHEFNSSKRLREILGSESRKTKSGTGISTRFLYLSDDPTYHTESEGFLSWYDSREKQPNRAPEWRLYYSTNNVIGINGLAKEGDTLVIGFKPDLKEADVFIAAEGSSAENQLKWLFGISNVDENNLFSMQGIAPSETIGMTRAQILEAVGVNLEAKDDNLLETISMKFGSSFPPSVVFSAFIRDRFKPKNLDDPDHCLTHWMESEEFAFRLFEKHLLQSKLNRGFENVDDFIACSLSVQNRRKSRAGLAFENHLAEVFRYSNLVFEHGPKLENKAKPDFLFPSREHYFREEFPIKLMTLLGAKTSCKDRWRQVLSEGTRFTERHLATLEPAISSNQLEEMQSHNLQLVVPKELQSTYPEDKRGILLSVSGFIAKVHERQKSSGIAG